MTHRIVVTTSQPDFAAIATAIAQARGKQFVFAAAVPIGGGCIHGAVRLSGGEQRYFVKFNGAEALPMFEAEADGLAGLGETGAIRVPQVIAIGRTGDHAYLVLEYLELGPLDRSAGIALGRALAALHRHVGEHWGWCRDNYIGRTPQANSARHAGWANFFADERLRPQLALAAKRGMDAKWLQLGEYVAEHVGGFFVDYSPTPTLLHGDLWSGNAAALGDGKPVLFDPAVYRGDREADLAMAELFGGFPEAFYAAYREAWPLDPGYETRKTLYNLYHVLNHLHLFGSGYLGQAQRMIGRLHAELRG